MPGDATLKHKAFDGGQRPPYRLIPAASARNARQAQAVAGIHISQITVARAWQMAHDSLPSATTTMHRCWYFLAGFVGGRRT
jgi:hypothetical protein